ncbi:MAG: phosphoesterase [Pirellulales bacterium]
MSTVETERVLVVPTDLFRRLGYFQGFSRDTERYLPEMFDAQHVSYRPRAAMEKAPDFKQLIPYVLFRHTDASGTSTIFQYTRGCGQGEERLHRKRSVGVGGHIASVDAETSGDGDPYREGMQRELAEEVIIDTPTRGRCVGLINDDETEVGRVHLGIVHLIDCDRPAVRSRETEILEAGFRPIHQVLTELDQFETWSRICMQALFNEATFDETQ